MSTVVRDSNSTYIVRRGEILTNAKFTACGHLLKRTVARSCSLLFHARDASVYSKQKIDNYSLSM